MPTPGDIRLNNDIGFDTYRYRPKSGNATLQGTFILASHKGTLFQRRIKLIPQTFPPVDHLEYPRNLSVTSLPVGQGYVISVVTYTSNDNESSPASSPVVLYRGELL